MKNNLLYKVQFFINNLRCKKILKQNKDKQYHYIATICAIAKNEEEYLVEWIEHHLSLGFQHIFLIDNNDNPGLEKMLLSFLEQNTLTIIPFHGIKHCQVQAYEYVALYYGGIAKWMVFIDIDEFFILKQDVSIIDFLKEYEDIPAIGVNWRMYGSNGHIMKQFGKVMERFPLPANTPTAIENNKVIKSIIRPLLLITMYDATMRYTHHWTLPTYGEHKDRIFSAYRKISYDKIWLNHYSTKSYEECRVRCLIGDAVVKSSIKNVKDRFFAINDISMMKEVEEFELSLKNN